MRAPVFCSKHCPHIQIQYMAGVCPRHCLRWAGHLPGEEGTTWAPALGRKAPLGARKHQLLPATITLTTAQLGLLMRDVLFVLHTSAIYDLHIFLTIHVVLGCLISKSKCNLLCTNVPHLLSAGRATLADSVTKPASPHH